MRGSWVDNGILIPAPYLPAGVREPPTHPLDGVYVHWTYTTTPSCLPRWGEGIVGYMVAMGSIHCDALH